MKSTRYLRQQPIPFAAYESLDGLPIVRGPAVQGVSYFTTTAYSGREGMALCPADEGAFNYSGLNVGLSTGAEVELVLSNRERLNERLPAEAIYIHQVHGADVYDADNWQAGAELVSADALITTQVERPLLVQTADCMPIVLVDERSEVLGVVHAGWRSLLQGVIENTVAAMQLKRKQPIGHVWIGPSISTLAFEVGAEVRAEFIASNPLYEAFFFPKANQPDKYLANLAGIAQHKLSTLQEQGLVAEQAMIYYSALCSYGMSDWFYSYRRNPRTGRLATVAYLFA